MSLLVASRRHRGPPPTAPATYYVVTATRGKRGTALLNVLEALLYCRKPFVRWISSSFQTQISHPSLFCMQTETFDALPLQILSGGPLNLSALVLDICTIKSHDRLLPFQHSQLSFSQLRNPQPSRLNISSAPSTVTHTSVSLLQ